MKNVDSAMMLTTGSSGTIFEKINEMSRLMDDTKVQLDLKLDERLSRKVNDIEDRLKKFVNSDFTRINTELLNLNNSFSKFCNEQRSMEEKVNKKLFTSKTV